MLAGPDERIHAALRAQSQVQWLLAELTFIFVKRNGALTLLSEDLADRVRGSRDIGIFALHVGSAVNVDLDHARRVLPPEAGRRSPHRSIL